MQLEKVSPRNFINPLLSKKSVDLADFKKFTSALEIFKKQVAEQHAAKQSEPNIVTNALKPFLESFALECSAVSQHGQSGIDLAVMKSGKVGVIVEAKLATSKDMICEKDINKKSMHEAILYFMREREKNNNAIYHVIVTNFHEWFVFDAKDFDRLFWRNPVIQKIWKNYLNPNLLGNEKTEMFYHLLEKQISQLKQDLITEEAVQAAYFDIRDEHSEKDLVAIYKLLIADNLLKEFNPNDANSLNRDFYTELLYILGLEEAKQGGKKIIGRSRKPQAGSIYENTQSTLAQHGKNDDFDSIIKLVIIWINRILFTKLLESQIVKWTATPKSKFLHKEKVENFGQLQSIFFTILAKRIQDRKTHEFDYIPYMNSSLFEHHKDEQDGIFMSSLDSGVTMNYYPRTVVKDANSKPKKGAVSTLHYLFEFLDAYDFSNDGGDEVVNESKSLISASVLGLIFEKINGYKDGSFYTPSFITMYMAQETIRSAILERFNKEFNDLDANTWGDLKSFCDKHSHKEAFREQVTPLVDGITVCDPAVGSGHFLVSVLNELIVCKYELGLLNFKGLSIKLENDELLVSLDDEWFEYARPKNFSSPAHLLQKTLFHEKQRIIENQLFGVDINANSTQITKLRLWIELLKNSYYDDEYQLVTLPNIDINIKAGNSLVSRFDLADNMAGKDVKKKIVAYKQKVSDYKKNLGTKSELLATIEEIKNDFKLDLKKGHKASTTLQKKLIEYVNLFGYKGLDKDLAVRAFEAAQGQSDMFGADAAIANENKEKKGEIEVQLKKMAEALRELETGKIYENAFEWRIEFPELLGPEGNYSGFDIVIGNPPYGVALSDMDKASLKEKYLHQDYQLDTYLIFMELGLRIAKENGQLAFIVPNTWLTNLKLKKIRSHITSDNYVSAIAHYSRKIFDEAVVDTQTLFARKTNSRNENVIVKVFDGPQSSASHVADQNEWAAMAGESINIFMREEEILLRRQLEHGSVKLGTVVNLVVGMKPYQTGKGNPKQTASDVANRVFDADMKIDDSYKPLLRGSDIQKYRVSWKGSNWIKYGAWLAEPRLSANFGAERKIVIRQTGDSLIAALDKEQFVCMNNLHVLTLKDSALSLEYILAIVNSKLMDYYHSLLNPEKGEALAEVKKENLEKLPIKILSDQEQAPFIDIVSKIHAATSASEMSVLEQKLDLLVYQLYGVPFDSIRLIDPAFTGMNEEDKRDTIQA